MKRNPSLSAARRDLNDRSGGRYKGALRPINRRLLIDLFYGGAFYALAVVAARIPLDYDNPTAVDWALLIYEWLLIAAFTAGFTAAFAVYLDPTRRMLVRKSEMYYHLYRKPPRGMHRQRRQINHDLLRLSRLYARLPQHMNAYHSDVRELANEAAASVLHWQFRVSTEPTSDWRDPLAQWVVSSVESFADGTWETVINPDAHQGDFPDVSRAQKIALVSAGILILVLGIGQFVWLLLERPELVAVGSIVLPISGGIAYMLFDRAGVRTEVLKSAQEFGGAIKTE